MNKKFAKFYMDIAQRAAAMSYAKRLQVGCVIVKDTQIISTSWNGTPSGWDNECETRNYIDGSAGSWMDPDQIREQWPYTDEIGLRYQLKTKPEVLHAEMNSLCKLAKSTVSGVGASLFVTHAPCMDCAKLIAQSGIKEVYYRTAYRETAGLEFLNKSGIVVEQLTEE